MDKATSSDSYTAQMSEISSKPIVNQMSVTYSEPNVEQVEIATSGDQIVEFVVTLVDSEMVTPSSDPIEIAAVTRSQSKQESDVGEGNTGSVTLLDEKNRMLRDMNITKFKEMQE